MWKIFFKCEAFDKYDAQIRAGDLGWTNYMLSHFNFLSGQIAAHSLAVSQAFNLEDLYILS